MLAFVHVHRGLGPRIATLQHAACPERSWVKNDAGAARIVLPMGDPECQQIDAANVYVVESDTGIAPWIGYMPSRWEEDGTTLTVPLRELSAVLDGRFTGPADSYATGAGGILQAAVRKALRQAPLAIELGDMSDPGPYRAKDLRNSSLLSVAKDLADDTGYLWWVDYTASPEGITARLRWSSRRGVDRTATVLLEEGRNVKEDPYFSNRTGQPLTSVTAVGSTSITAAQYAARPSATAQATGATTVGSDALATTAVVIDEHAADTRSALQTAQTALDAAGGMLARCTATDPALWAQLRMDDLVRLRWPRYNRGLGLDVTARISGIQPDEFAGELLLALEVQA